MLIVQCPKCRKQIAALPEARGKPVACPLCEQVFIIGGAPIPATLAADKPAAPAPSSAPHEEPFDFLQDAFPATQAAERGDEPVEEPALAATSHRLLWILGGVAGTLGLVLVILIAVWLSGSTSPQVAAVVPSPDAEPKALPAPEPKTPVRPKIEPPPKVEPPPVKPPKIEPPKVVAPKVEPKKAEPPKKVEPPKPEPPKVDEVTSPDDLQDKLTALLTRLNEYRQAAKLAPVAIDPELSRGCQAHARYVNVNRNHPKLAAAAGLQDEDAALPAFDAAGRKAAQSSMLAYAEPAVALDLWFARMNSRTPLLHPSLQSIGVGATRTSRGEWVTVLDPLRGHAAPSGVVYPAPNQKGVPLSFSGGPEVPDAPAGFPVSLQFPNNQAPTGISALLTDVSGNLVPVSLSTPEQPLPSVRRPGLVGMIPKQPFAAKTTYRARVSGQIDDRPFTRDWTFTTEDDGDEDGVLAAKMLERINALRRQAELKPVTLDNDLSRACRLHARYLVVNAHRPEAQGMGAHREDKSLPGYTPEGEKAAKASDIALGDYEPTDALDGWMATLYHRVPILEPELRAIGFGCARGRRLGWITVLDVATRREPGARSRPVFWPAENQTNVPLHFPPGGETPNPIPNDKTGRAGYPITAFFPFALPVLNSKASLEDASGKPVPCWFSSRESPANPKYLPHQGNTICLIPKEPLRPEQKYRVTMTGDQLGNTWKKSWTFTTAKLGASSSDAVEAATAHFNKARLAAGLPPVTLDPELSKGCQAHAEYLVKNAALRDTKGFSLVDEDPKLPGFSPAGQASAKKGDVFWLAPSPTTQVDDLLGTLYRRTFALDPRLRRIGLGCAYEIGQGWINVLDLNSGRDGGDPVVFPANGQEKVPLAGRDKVPGEKVSGYPITVWFPGGAKIGDVRAKLAESSGTTLDIWVSTPTAPFDRGVGQANVIAIHPARPLRPGQVYSVTVSADVNGASWRHSGRFSTVGE